VLGDLLDTLYHVLVTYAVSHAPLAAKTLAAVASLIDWIDIGLVLNERYVPLLFSFLANGALQLGAVHCLFEMVHKRMDHARKVALIQQLQLLEIIGTLAVDAPPADGAGAGGPGGTSGSGSPGGGGDDDGVDYTFPERVAALAGTVALNLIACVERLPEQVREAQTRAQAQTQTQTQQSPSAGDEAAALARALAEAQRMLEPALELAFRWFASDAYETANEVMPLIEKYVNVLKGVVQQGQQQQQQQQQQPQPPQSPQSQQSALSAAQSGHLARILALCAKQLRYPRDYNHADRQEDEAAFDEYRTAVAAVVVNVAKLAPPLALDFVRTRFAQTAQQLGALSGTIHEKPASAKHASVSEIKDAVWVTCVLRTCIENSLFNVPRYFFAHHD
jgi:hypothetical protein